MNANLLLNQKPKQQGETFNLPDWKNSSGCDTKNSVSPKKLECPLEIKFFVEWDRMSPLSEILDQTLPTPSPLVTMSLKSL